MQSRDLFASLQHQAVRDLAWCCLSSPLLSAFPNSDARILPLPEMHQDLVQWLKHLDQNPEPILQSLAQIKSTRLGIYYEQLWSFYFSHQPHWQLLAQNLPVYRGKVTLGAFDFLCRYGDAFWHIETAVKFYLCDTRNPREAEDWHRWLGPNSNDRLDLKLARLGTHQLPLHQTDEGQARLAQAFPQARHWQSGLCLQGYLFSPAPEKLSAGNIADGISEEYFLRPKHSHPDQGTGLWWHLRDFLLLLAETPYPETPSLSPAIRWIILEYHQWFSPIHLSDEQTEQHRDRLNEHISQHILETKRPLMLAAVKKEDAELEAHLDHWREHLRAFVVPDGWPSP